MGGIFIVFEGIDGSGKSSCLNSVASFLEKDHDVVVTAEPTKGEIGSLIRSSGNLSPEAEALLFTADRAQHTAEIGKWIDEGKTVLCDRYFASTIAYQSADLNGRSADRRWLTMINMNVIIRPDITLLFDIDPEESFERVESRGEKSRFERLDYLKEVRKNYLRLAKKYGFEVIDASKPKDGVLKDVLKIILKMI